MLEREVFIGELVSVNGLSTSTVVVGEVSTLAHKVLSKYTVKSECVSNPNRYVPRRGHRLITSSLSAAEEDLPG